jgi:hypothetical protein
VNGQRRRDGEDLGGDGSERNRIEVLERIVGHLGVDQRVDDEARVHHQNGVAIACCLRDAAGANRAAPAAHVLDDKLLAEMLRELLRDEAANGIVLPAGRERNDHAHRPRRVGLRLRSSRQGGERGSTGGEAQEVAAGKCHGVLLDDAPIGCGLTRIVGATL